MSKEALKLAQDWYDSGNENPDDFADMIKKVIALAQQPAQQQEPVGRTDQQIVDQTEALAVWLLSWGFNHQPETSTPMRESTHPFAERCWAAACHIQEMLTATDPENSVAELDGESGEDTSPPAQRTWVGLTDEERKDALLLHYEQWEAEELLDGSREDYLLIEAKLKEKNT